jgi:outer membrane murein-binding lipoprotein Lpp
MNTGLCRLCLGAIVVAAIMSGGCSRQDEESRKREADQQAQIQQLQSELDQLKTETKREQLSKEVEALKSTKISGSVFVVTRGGESIKLALVSVELLTPDQYSRYLDSVKAAMIQDAKGHSANVAGMLAVIELRRRDCASCMSAYNDALGPYKSAKNDLEQYCIVDDSTRTVNVKSLYGLDDNSRPVFAQFNACLAALAEKGEALSSALSTYRDGVDSVKTEREAILGILSGQRDFVFDHLSDPKVITKSDEDGHFTFTVDRPVNTVVLARANRSVGDSTENYYWIATVTGTADDGEIKVMLTNDNMVDTVPMLDLKDVISLVPADITEPGNLTIVTNGLPYQIQ